MSDFSVSVGGDFSELLRGFKQLEQQAQASGQSVGKGIAEGIQGYSTKSITALQAELARLQSRQTRVAVDSSAFEKTGQRIKEVQALITEVERRRLAIGVDDRSITGLQTKLAALQSKQTKVSVDDQEFTALQREIDKLDAELAQVSRKKLLINADPRSVAALSAQLGDLRDELNRVEIGSQRFRELQAAIQSTERELQKAGQAADGFNIIDGAIQGIAFSLTNTVTNAAATALRAIGGLVSGFAALDTEIRQAAAAAGEPGGYDKIARSIDQVGIEAAGTQQEVAQLATELIRGGMTVDQMNASLGAIVRGAEATGTGFAQMGSVVSASLKGFGLQATDAKRVVDALVTGANASASSVEGMGMAFKYAAPVARILGVSVEELGIAVGLLTNAGIDASEAGVTLRNGLSKLASAAPQTGGSMQKLTGQAKIASDTMKQLGINIYNADGTLQPMETTLLKLKGAFDKLDPSSKIRLAANLFGGEDDGTKWLALLNQSESEIKKMSATMANTKGATDTARDAMQGFQMQMNQLTGTLDSLGKTVGGVGATALAPLVGLANQAVGAIAGLPSPVKAVGSALILVAGAAATATAAMVIFQRAMQVTAVQAAAAEIGSLATTMATTLGGAVKAVVAAIPGLITQLGALSATKASVALSAVATTLKTTFLDAVGAAAKGLARFVAYITSTSFATFIAGVKSAVVALAPLALAVGAITAAITAWQYVLGGSKDSAETFASAQEEADKAVAGLGKSIKATADEAAKGRAPIIGFFQDAREQMAQLAAAQELSKLQGSFTKVQTSAISFLETLRSGSAVTAAQATEALKYVEALKQIASTAANTANALRQKAEAEKRAGNTELAKQYLIQANALDSEARASSGLSAALTVQINRSKDAGAATAQQKVLTDEQKKAVQERTKAEEELNKVIAQAPVRSLEAQLAMGQQLVGLSKALGDREQSRFGIVKAGLQFELQALQDRGAGEAAIAAKKTEIDRVERAALSARYRALVQQQALESAMLEVSQQKARLEADLSVKQQEIELLKAKAALSKLSKDASQEEKDAATAQVKLQEGILGVTQEKVGLLDKTQPLERASADVTAEIARNGLQAEAHAKGYAIAADGSLVKTQGIASSLERVSVLSGASAEQQDRFRQVAEQSGLAISRAADGSLVLGRTQADVALATGVLNGELAKVQGGYADAAKGAGDTRGQTDQLRQTLAGAGLAALGVAEKLGDSAGGAKGAGEQTKLLREALWQSQDPASGVAGAFVSVGKNAPAAVQGARDFAAWMSQAKVFAERIAGLNLALKMTSVRDATRGAADEAKRFYDWLLKASGLPGSRWTGGPVEAGAEYRVNELGQEALLSAGRLSLINAPQNAIWRAPSSGVVVPAGITARLQEAGALPSPGGQASGGGNAELAVEIGKLRQEVGELARRQWNINVTQRTGVTGSQVLRTLQQLR